MLRDTAGVNAYWTPAGPNLPRNYMTKANAAEKGLPA